MMYIPRAGTKAEILECWATISGAILTLNNPILDATRIRMHNTIWDLLVKSGLHPEKEER